MAGIATVLRGDARSLPLPDASVDLVVTSPPYYALRSYTDGGEHYAGQIGSEATPAEYIAALIDCTREWMRVLKPSGSMWVDLGDKYDSSSHAMNGVTSSVGFHGGNHDNRAKRRPVLGRPKSLMLLPERYRIAAVDQLGLIARAVVIWSKPNGLPESVTDRVRRSHEDWVHLTLRPKYYAAVDEIREPHRYPDEDRARPRREASKYAAAMSGRINGTTHALGALPGSVWQIPTEPLTVPDHLGVDHFAAFPTEWCRRIILGWSPSGICTGCGQGRRPVADVQYLSKGDKFAGGTAVQGRHRSGVRMGDGAVATITGYACACPDTTAPTRPAVVLDPFGGTGTTALVASVLGRTGVSVDRSADYSRLAAWRTTDRGEIAKAMRVDKPPVIAEAQMALEWEVA